MKRNHPCGVKKCISFHLSFPGDEVVTVKTPAFAESVTEGDVRWEKGNDFSFLNQHALLVSDTITAKL